MDTLLQRIIGEWQHLVAIESVEDHRIQSDTIEAAFHGAIDAPQYGVEITDTGNGFETFGLQAIETDVDRVHAGIAKGMPRFSKLAAIGGQRQRVGTREGA